MQAAARATGISQHRIRTWERRHGVPAPERSPSGRRLYNDEDLRVIRAMARLIDAGVPAEEAARAARSSGRLELPDLTGPANQPATGSLIESLLESTRNFDGQELERQLHQAFAESGNEDAIARVAMPFLHAVGDGWARAELGVAAEHFASEIVRRVLLSRAHGRRQLAAGSPVLVLACPAGERHDLGMLALWLLLLDWELGAVLLGADVPATEIVAACQAANADAACMAATSSTALPAMWLTSRRLVEQRRSRRVFVGGPAVHREQDTTLRIGEVLPAAIPDAARWIAAELGSRYRGLIETTRPGGGHDGATLT